MESTKMITTGHYLVTDPNSEFNGQTLKVQSGSYGHLGQQIGVLLELKDKIGFYTQTFLWWQISRVETLTDDQKEAYYYEQQIEEQNYSPAHWGL